MMKYYYLFILSFVSQIGFSQQGETKILLSDLTIQMECAEAIDALYDFDFYTAEKQFTWLKQKYPTHPLPYFLMGLSQWWRIMPNDIVTKYDDAFYAYMDSSIYFAEELLDQDEKNPEASFFLAGAYGFKARLQSDRNNYTSAAFTARKCLDHMHENRTEDQNLGPEFYFGDALYNYYREWIPENLPKLKPILLFFKKGDKEKGLKQLKEVADNAFYTRVEATTFLMRIYNEYEKEYADAYKYSKYLHEVYPNNPYFDRYYTKVCFTRGYLKEALERSDAILQKVDSNRVGYDAESGRVASYYSGYINMTVMRDTVVAEERFLACAKYTEELALMDESVLERGYYLNALRSIGLIAAKKGDQQNAVKHYSKYIQHSDKKDKYYKEAEAYLKANGPKDKSWWKLW